MMAKQGLLATLTGLQALRRVLDAAPLPFSLELACLAAVRQVLNLEDWVGDYYARDPRNTVIQLMTFLEQRALVRDFEGTWMLGDGNRVLIGRFRSGSTGTCNHVLPSIRTSDTHNLHLS
jgi:hypothetical protein